MPIRRKKQKPVPVFVSYAHKDFIRCDELREHLTTLERHKILDVWWDGKIHPAIPWATDIIRHLKQAKIVVLLVSARFNKSWYCNKIEVEEAMARHNKKKTVVVPVLIGHCHHKHEPWAAIDAEPKAHKTVTGNRDRRDAAWTEVAEKLERIALKKS